jgi:tRNA pseudouridine13 synthase
VVNEVDPDGKVVVLKNMKYDDPSAPENKPKSDKSSVQDNGAAPGPPSIDLTPLSDHFTPEIISQLHDLYTSKGISPTEVTTDVLAREQRTAIHQTIRTVFNSKLESQATSTGSIRITCPKNVVRRSASKWSEGEYTHFSLKKANRDTMSTASTLSKWLKVHGRILGYAGTKDRRAITTQRMSAHRTKPARLAALNKIANPMGIWLGDFTCHATGVKLGDLSGNRFTITLREVPLTTDLAAIEKAMGSLRERGFINYYGMQRFGTSLVSTHSVGALLLNAQWKAACEAILDVKAGGMNDSIVAREMYAKGDVEEAFQQMPRGCIAERAILGVLRANDKHFSGALQAVFPL